MTRRVKIDGGSGNIFADLGLPDADTHFLKAQIVSEIHRLAKERKLTQVQVGRRIGISQPEVSRMFKGHFREYSIERLMEFLTGFDRDVEIAPALSADRPGPGGETGFGVAGLAPGHPAIAGFPQCVGSEQKGVRVSR